MELKIKFEKNIFFKDTFDLEGPKCFINTGWTIKYLKSQADLNGCVNLWLFEVVHKFKKNIPVMKIPGLSYNENIIPSPFSGKKIELVPNY